MFNEKEAMTTENQNGTGINFMKRIRNSRTAKGLFLFIAFTLITEIVAPTAALALTSGPTSPEFASFEPVATTDMVNDFTGAFNYNIPVISIPGTDGGGYSMSLSYHAGASPEEESSWVGFGWSLNPGAINRMKRGVADDFKDVSATHYNKTKPNWTQVTGFDCNLELNSLDKEKGKKKKTADKENRDLGKSVSGKADVKFKLEGFDLNSVSEAKESEADRREDGVADLAISLKHSIRYNNYSGFSSSNSLGGNFKNLANLDVTRSGGETTMGFSVVSPMKIFSNIFGKKSAKAKEDSKKSFENGDAAGEASNKSKSKTNKNIATGFAALTGMYSQWTFEAPAVTYSVAKVAGHAYNYSISLQLNPAGPLGFQFGIQGHMNYQASEPMRTMKQYGYLYNPKKDKYEKGDIEADFQIEKESTFNRQDNHLGIPFNTADIFSASGNDVNGGFQFYHNQIGHFYPNFIENDHNIEQLGLEVGLGGTISVGLDVGAGRQRTKVSDWEHFASNETSPKADLEFLEMEGPNAFMRFSGDMGGEISYSGNDELDFAKVGGNVLRRNLDFANLTTGISKLDTERQGQTSRIEYAYYKLNGTGYSLQGEADHNKIIKDYAVSNRSKTEEYNYHGLIGQIAVINKSGNRSVYGLPVFSKDDMELTVGMPYTNAESDRDDIRFTKESPKIDAVSPLKNHTVVGRKSLNPWASTYLLTQTNTFDYIDLTNDGPTNDDFGGWTRFGYAKASKDNAWYGYRAPFKGGYYNRGNLNDDADQTVSMSAGKREVYYLNHIETKTHIGFFVTNLTTIQEIKELLGSNMNQKYGGLTDAIIAKYLVGSSNPRLDGWGAKLDGTGRDESVAPRNLEKIVLFSKDDFKKPITTTYFQYEYLLCKGTPNSTANNGSKLTLTKMWTEGGGMEGSRIAPYEFKYSYFTDYSSQIMAKYPDLLDVVNLGPNGSDKLTEADQNPNYEPGQLDAWGNYRLDGEKRFVNMQPWLDQTVGNTTPKFDPAAWQLKRIILPSGGEIHIQYEQNEYETVQDQVAMGMTALKETPTVLYNNNSKLPDLVRDVLNIAEYKELTYGYRSGIHSRYYLNTSSIDVNEGDKFKYLNVLKDYFVVNKNKIYFKYLYNIYDLHGASKPELKTFNKTTQYITGYTTVNNVGEDNTGIYIELGELTKKKNPQIDKTLPRWVGFSYLKNQGNLALAKSQKLSNQLKEDDQDFLEAAYGKNTEPKDAVDRQELRMKGRGKVLKHTFNFFSEWVGGNIKNPLRHRVCPVQNFELSYLKLPLFKPKKGGGIRVKRILSYDPGIETNKGDAMVYGTRYRYFEGAATNEPSEMREENALVEFLERKKQAKFNKLLNGRDSKQMEGPLGEMLLPGASIGYGRIEITNIHNGKSSAGKIVNTYHTCKTFPMEVKYSGLTKNDNTYRKFNLSLPLGLVNIEMHKAWLTQGYLFLLKDMHGKLQSQQTFGLDALGTKYSNVSSTSTEYVYSKPGEKVTSLIYNAEKEDRPFEIGSFSPGQEEDITMYRSQVEDVTNNFSLEIDLNITLPFVITLGFGVSFDNSNNLLCQHVTTKVIRQTTQLLSVTSTADGIKQTTENIAFNKHTGEPVLTRTYDNYSTDSKNLYATNTLKSGIPVDKHEGKFYSLNIPGTWIYKELRNSYQEGEGDNKNTYFGSNQYNVNVGNVVTYGINDLDAAIDQYKLEKKNAPSKSEKDLNDILWENLVDNRFSNVISSNAVVLKNNWFQGTNVSELLTEYSGTTVGEAVIIQLNKNYYPLCSYTYRASVTNAHEVGIYNGGIIKEEVPLFDWITNDGTKPWNSIVGNWYAASRVLSYSPHGVPLLEENAIGIKSVAKYNSDKTLPKLVAQNASYNQVEFIDYENLSGDAIQVNDAHSGYKSLIYKGNNAVVLIKDYDLTNLSSGFTLKLWVKSNLSSSLNSPNYGKKNPNPQMKAIVNNKSYNLKKIASSGEWTLYGVDVFSADNGTGKGDVTVTYQMASPTELVLFDDVRMQPIDAQMNCIVYTPDKKVAAQFDDQHFGVYYEYNAQGVLVRNTIETERGRKTIKEQQQNVHLRNR